MSEADFHRDRPSSHLLGKEFIIVVVVVFSALSFTLGYFVGRSGEDRKTENLSQSQEIVAVPQSQERTAPLQPQDRPLPETVPLYEEKAEEPVRPQPKEVKPDKNLQPVNEKAQAAAVPKQKAGDEHQKPAAKKSIDSRENKKPEGPVYTVQIGAFKSLGEAEACRKKQAKNKLKTYITTATNTKKEKVYKVRTGEFRDKKSAEVLSLKLSKTEKLKTYVTLKNE